MTNTPSENGERMRAFIASLAAAGMPPPVQLIIKDGSQQYVEGAVWADLEGQTTQVIIGGNMDYRDGEHVIYAYPMGVGASNMFLFASHTFNGADDSRVPRQRIKTKVYTNDVSNPPTDAQLDSIFGTPAANKGEIFQIDDNGAGSNFYLVASDGTNWWTFAGTKAA